MPLGAPLFVKGHKIRDDKKTDYLCRYKKTAYSADRFSQLTVLDQSALKGIDHLR
jgi:benzoyl-CoA reductase/2-hydroxyglutaryl-CoA dehydratase subunit BcrC/BadD/HgdB